MTDHWSFHSLSLSVSLTHPLTAINTHLYHFAHIPLNTHPLKCTHTRFLFNPPWIFCLFFIICFFVSISISKALFHILYCTSPLPLSLLWILSPLFPISIKGSHIISSLASNNFTSQSLLTLGQVFARFCFEAGFNRRWKTVPGKQLCGLNGFERLKRFHCFLAVALNIVI